VHSPAEFVGPDLVAERLVLDQFPNLDGRLVGNGNDLERHIDIFGGRYTPLGLELGRSIEFAPVGRVIVLEVCC
jgi:hypothetical protein